MATLEQFRRRMDVLSKQVLKNSGRVIQKVALEVDRRLVLQTPVDEGRARSNWLVGINSANRGTKNPESANGAIARAANAIAAAKPGDVIFISNNLAYISLLNDGRSVQAQGGYVDAIVADAALLVQRFKLLEAGTR